MPASATAADSAAYYTQLLEELPGDPDIYYNRGTCYFRLGRYNEAITDFSAALRLSPGYRSAYLPRADCHRLLGNYKFAVPGYDSALAAMAETHNDSTAYVYNSRAWCHFRLGNFAAAARDYSEVIRQGRGTANTYLCRGIAFYKDTSNMNYKAATIDLWQSTVLAPDSALAYLWLGNAYFKLSDWDKAIDSYQKAKKAGISAVEETHESEAYCERAKTLAESDTAQALKDLNEAITANPSNGNAYYLRGLLLVSLGKNDLACLDFEQAGLLGVTAAFREARTTCYTQNL